MTSKCIKGFKVLPLRFSNSNSNYHELFFKEHSVRNYDVNKPPGRTLFVINVPPYASENGLKNAFSNAGAIKSITLQKSVSESVDDKSGNCGFQVAFIVFEKHDGLLKALKLESLNPLCSEQESIVTRINKWVKEYNSNIYNHEKLSNEIKAAMAKNDTEEKKQDEKQNVDEDGWTVVTKKSRKPGIARKESVGRKIIQKSKLKLRKKELRNFYTFQLKEEKMKNVIALRKNFQDSKEKVNLMKKMRNFKPY